MDTSRGKGDRSDGGGCVGPDSAIEGSRWQDSWEERPFHGGSSGRFAYVGFSRRWGGSRFGLNLLAKWTCHRLTDVGVQSRGDVLVRSGCQFLRCERGT